VDGAAERIVVSGRVQGVWYRAWTVENARALGLRGWVRNRADGSVEALAIGAPAAIDELVRRCHAGPPKARVTGVSRMPADDDGSVGFTQAESA
jgi:acylphosphatase